MAKPASASSIEELLSPAKPAVSAPATATPAKSAAPQKPVTAKKITSATDKLSEKMTEIQWQEKEKLAQQHATDLGMNYISLRAFPIAPEALSLILRKEAETRRLVAFLKVGNEIRVALTEPSEDATKFIKELEDREHAHVEVYLVSDDSIERALKLYDTLPEVKEVIYGYRIEEKDLERYAEEISDFRQLQERIGKVSTTDIITLMIGASLKSNASDIHVEAEEEDVKIRYRMDGILHDAATLPRETWKQIISRLKLLAGVKINVDDVPQDGRITIYLTNEKLDIRVSFLPTSFGESVVMRLLRPKSIALEFDNLGIRGLALTRLQAEIEKPNGMIITTGPTGSGKTTTLYAILKKLNSPEEKIITLEDPVEYKLKGINQSQIQHDKGYDFAKGLRAILRQDPDVVMVGEIRDLETADIAIQAALTGHLVVSTIHTNSAAGAIPRFLSMGVKPFLLAPALNAVIGQRLVRRLCEKCKVPAVLSPSSLAQAKQILGSISPASNIKVDIGALKFMDAKKGGCEFCHGQGYKGRVGIYEIFNMTKTVEEAILGGAISEYQIQEIALKEGMITMAQDGLLKAADGLTSIEEVLAASNVDTFVTEPEAPVAPKTEEGKTA
ncbi:MAG: GspE/PulE family protein [Patescibacteria group bacterium]